jgi:glycoside/pentoside/hexuronide:cation symporter, GPH family
MTSLAPSEKLSFREKLFYGFGDLGSCLFWNSFMFNLLLYYTDVFGITAAAASLIFFVSKFWDAANDPMVGMLADRTRTRWGRYRPFILWFSLPLCVAAVLMFTTPDFAPWGKLVWAWVTYNLVMTLYTLVNIPYTALLGTISPDVKERGSVSTFKFACAFSAGIIVSYTFMPMTESLADGSPQRGWQLAFLVISAIALPFFLLCFFGTRERVTPVKAEKSLVREDLKDLFANRPWMILVGLTMAFVFFVAVRSTISNHYLKYFVIGGAGDGTVDVAIPFLGTQQWGFATLQRWFNTTDQFASVIGVLLGGLFVKRLEKRWNFTMWFSLAIAGTVWGYWLRPDQVELILIANIIKAGTSAPLCVLIWAMYADAAEYSEWRNRRQAAGLVFSASTFAQQLGWGFGPAAAGSILDFYGYKANEPQSGDVLNGMVLLMTLIPAAFGVLSIVFMMLYPLNDRRVHEMSEELKKRRATAFEPPESAAGTALKV